MSDLKAELFHTTRPAPDHHAPRAGAPGARGCGRALGPSSSPSWRGSEVDVAFGRRPRASGGGDPPARPPAPGEGEDVELEDAPVSSIPRRYKVIFHNDDYTTQEFVIFVLERFFHKSETEARHIMLTVHHKGAAVAGVYTKDVAETKAQQVMDAARENGMPLLLTTEPE